MGAADVFPIINCVDLPRARRFYVSVFDAKQIYQFPEVGEPVYLTLGVGDGQIALGLGDVPAAYGETPLPATGHAIDVCIYVPELDAVVERARLAGGSVPVEPADMPWGERVAYVRDPEGTMILTIQIASE